MTAATVAQTDGDGTLGEAGSTFTTASITPISSGSNSDRLAVLMVTAENGNTAFDLNTAVWNGQSLTEHSNGRVNDSFQMSWVFYLTDANFPGSAGTIVLTFSDTAGGNVGVTLFQCKDAQQEEPQDQADAINVDSYSITISENETLVLQSATDGSAGDYVVTSPATELDNQSAASDFSHSAGKVDDQSSGSLTLNASGTSPTRRLHYAVGIGPASPGGGGGGANLSETVIIL